MTATVRPPRSARLGLAALLAATCLAAGLPAQERAPAGDPLLEAFRDPPAAARPRVWWHWMNGNISKDGIRKDLEWMKRTGIAGLQNFDANLITPQIVDKRLVYMTPEWKDAFRYAANLADQLDLELAIAASPGWSETGGPWVRPEDGVKKIAWSETIVTGGRRFTGVLPAPPQTTGPFQDVAAVDPLASLSGEKKKPDPVHYADSAVVAYRVTDTGALPAPRATLGDGKPLDAAPLADGRFATAVDVPRSSRDTPTVITLDYDRPQTIRSASLYVPGAASIFAPASIQPRLEASDDGLSWRKVTDVTLSMAPTTVSFAPVTARRFRIVFALAPDGPPKFTPAPGVDDSLVTAFFAAKPMMPVAELRLSSEARVNQWETKAGFSLSNDYYALDADAGPDVKGVPAAEVVDLTARMRPDGTLDWTPPEGSWRIVRMGWSLTGKTNHPAPAEATGLEVDKLDGRAVRDYLETYLKMYRDAAGADMIGARGVKALLTDSTEVGAFNWTPRILEEFRHLRGYDSRPWLPALTGAIVGSRSESDRFLYDFRRTIGELHASQHYGTVAAVAHENGLKVYGEALEAGRPSLGDDMDMRRYADVPMAALWTWPRDGAAKTVYLSDMRGAASVAHLYGQNLVAAESMTSAVTPWAHAPSDLRRIIDLEFANGINRPVIHTSVHQPVDDRQPGLSLLVFGQYFNRHETWAEMARPWIDYLARSGHMLQQGRFFADVAYFYGEESPTVGQTQATYFKDVPTRYAYDFVSPRAVRDLLKVDNGDLVAPSGARYRVLYLGGMSGRMTLPMLRHLAKLAESGATIVGDAPAGSPALGEDRPEYRALVARLWPGQSVTEVGRGRVIAGRDVEGALQRIGVSPDFSYAKPQPDSELLFVHRRLDDGDVYFVNNRRNRPERVEARFRVTGKAPEIWRADTGTSEPVSYRIDGNETIVPLDFEAEGSFFVVFRNPAGAPSATVARPAAQPVATLDGVWTVAFQPGRGAPASITLPDLGSLSGQANPGVRYFSGVSTYTKDFTVPAGHRPGQPLLLDLGSVGDVAEVRVNDRLVGTVWHAPYRLDIAGTVKPGRNRLEVRVANLWVNRLIGDVQPGAKKITFTTVPTYKPDAPLRPSGLIGPVRLMTAGR
ncbi:glycosyl hydrolase [Sphingomonas sp. DT-204]|uniref:glycosyl hydrolase n=1 Tax=Sphingomonas sp. DT-204 TaxID=3396166 RepID=UPI003F195419